MGCGHFYLSPFKGREGNPILDSTTIYLSFHSNLFGSELKSVTQILQGMMDKELLTIQSGEKNIFRMQHHTF